VQLHGRGCDGTGFILFAIVLSGTEAMIIMGSHQGH
jgi:hypothetical protein